MNIKRYKSYKKGHGGEGRPIGDNLGELIPPGYQGRNYREEDSNTTLRWPEYGLCLFVRYLRIFWEAVLPLGSGFVLAAGLFAFQKLPHLVEFRRRHPLGGVFTHKAIEHTAVGGIGKAQRLLINMYGSECSPTTVCLGRIHLVPFITAWDLRKAPSWAGFGAFLIGIIIPVDVEYVNVVQGGHDNV